jgi:RNase P/RNase MRP subunit p30
MQIINTPDINEARKQILLFKKENKPVIVRARNDEFNRKIFENPDIDTIIGLEIHERKDYLKQRDSGLNEVLCKLAKKNNIKIGIDIQEIKKLTEKKQKAIILARIKQNIELCKRTKTKIVFIPKIIKQEATSFMLSLGADTQQAKETI